MKMKRASRGFTLIELMIAIFIAFVVVLALGRIVTTNIRSWNQGQDKAVLQQNVTEALEWMARSVRGARTIVFVSDSEFRTYDELGNLVHTYQLSDGRLKEDGNDLVDRQCNTFNCITDEDTTSVIIELELENDVGTVVAARTRAAIRNKTLEF